MNTDKLLKSSIVSLCNRVFAGCRYGLEIIKENSTTIIKVSYTDFKPEEVVLRELRYVIGGNFDIRVQRNFSEKTIKDFLYELYRNTSKHGHAFHAQVDAAIGEKFFFNQVNKINH